MLVVRKVRDRGGTPSVRSQRALTLQNLFENVDLPVNGVAVDHDGDAFRDCRLTEALNQDKDGRRLRIEEPSLVADDDMVEHDVNVGHLERVERCDVSV